ncbi:MAG: DUF3800 domain-containing protein [Chromatiales bacterium]|nr:DUF3800 domain-containing protein [Chromatiales bacterium]
MDKAREFGDYVVYVDESGDHGLKHINPEFPVFVLAFCIFDKRAYIEQVVPAVQAFKFRYFGHDMVVLHEADIRKSKRPFDMLLNPEIREPFFRDLNALVGAAPFTIIASCILKEGFVARRGHDHNPYHVAMEFGLERVFLELQSRGQRGKLTHVIFERRGRREDDELELEFRRIMDESGMVGMADTLSLVLADKKSNSAGLQLADMVARPIGRRLLNPDQDNRAYEILEPKFRRNRHGQIEGWGLKCYP